MMALGWMLNRLAWPRIEERQQTCVEQVVDVRERGQILICFPVYHGAKTYLTVGIYVMNLITNQLLNFGRHRARVFYYK